jgi:hypothetical protein
LIPNSCQFLLNLLENFGLSLYLDDYLGDIALLSCSSELNVIDVGEQGILMT